MEVPTGADHEGHFMNITGSFLQCLSVASREVFRLIKMTWKKQSPTGKTVQLGSQSATVACLLSLVSY